MTIRIFTGPQSPGYGGRVEFDICMDTRRRELATVTDLAVRAEALGFPTIGERALDLAITIQADAPVNSYRAEIEALRGLILQADANWRRASMHHQGAVSPAEFDRIPTTTTEGN